MAPSPASLLVAALFAGAAASAAVPQLDQDAPIHVEAHSSDVDYKNNTLAFHDVRITQGGLAIAADEATATGLDLKASRWLFQGHVKITTPDGSLVSDEARIEFVANAISTAQITGAPASFEQIRDKRVARGHATHIDYDFGAGTVRLTEDAYLSDGDHEISGKTLIYDMGAQRVRANADDQDSQRVQITITPKPSDTKPEIKLDLRPGARPTARPDSKPDNTPEPKPDNTPAPKPDDTPAPKPDSTPAPKPDSTPAPKPDAPPDNKPNS